MPDPSDLDRLERELAALRREVAELRDAVRALGGAAAGVDARTPVAPVPAPAMPPAMPRAPARVPYEIPGLRAAHAPRAGLGLEDAVGRYGTVALAALLILMGVGAFLTWAVARFTLSPTARVALGAVLAVVLAAVGLRLRARADDADDLDADGEARAPGGARRFGDTLLALALAVVHVDAWGAGPYLGLVPDAVSLGVAAAASAALAALAWRAREQALFVVGVGGALIAPFVTASAPTHPIVLLTYGAIVLAAAAAALPRGRDGAPWDVAAVLLGLGGAGYVTATLGDAVAVAQLAGPAGGRAPLWRARRDLPALFAITNAVAVLALGGAAYGPRVGLAHLVTALVALAGLSLAVVETAPALVALALAATAVTYAALARWPAAAPAAAPVAASAEPMDAAATSHALASVALPLAFLGTALWALERAATPAGAALAATWAALAAAVAWHAHARGGATAPDAPAAHAVAAHVAAALLASALAPLYLLRGHPVSQAAALAMHAAAGALVLARLRHGAVAAAAAFVLTAATALAFDLLGGRPAWSYVPFATRESGAAATVVGAWVALAWAAWRLWRADPGGAARGRPLLSAEEATWHAAPVALAPLVALGWGREELAGAFSRDVATFLLVGYFAAAGIAVIHVGRVRRIPPARAAGLGLAIYAAIKALAQVSQVEAVGLRVGSYLLVGGFLLAVGWWYRAAGTHGAHGPPGRGAHE